MNVSETYLCKAAMELEELKLKEQSAPVTQHHRFPPNCMKLLYSIPGNQRCMDCNGTNPEWASLTFGTVLCICCSGRHRHMGVQVGFVLCNIVLVSFYFLSKGSIVTNHEKLLSFLLFLA